MVTWNYEFEFHKSAFWSFWGKKTSRYQKQARKYTCLNVFFRTFWSILTFIIAPKPPPELLVLGCSGQAILSFWCIWATEFDGLRTSRRNYKHKMRLFVKISSLIWVKCDSDQKCIIFVIFIEICKNGNLYPLGRATAHHIRDIPL